jgi:hypothetical protein
MTATELAPYMKMLEKHKLFLGRGWYNRHIAGMLLYGFFRHRPNKVRHLLYTVKRCGIVAVARVFAHRALQEVVVKYS